MPSDPQTADRATEASRIYRLGYYAAIKDALNAIAATAQRGDDTRIMCVRALLIEKVGGLKL
jgi:hypothetical protein